jgi:hypothetical protein
MFDGNRSTHDGKRYPTRDLDFDGNGFVNGEGRLDHHLSDKGANREQPQKGSEMLIQLANGYANLVYRPAHDPTRATKGKADGEHPATSRYVHSKDGIHVFNLNGLTDEKLYVDKTTGSLVNQMLEWKANAREVVEPVFAPETKAPDKYMPGIDVATHGKQSREEAHNLRKKILTKNLSNKLQQELKTAEEQLAELGPHATRETKPARVRLTAKVRTVVAQIAKYEKDYKTGLREY